MTPKVSQRFVRVPTELLEALLRLHLTGTQWRISFWVIRQTFGWNRRIAFFSWYRIALELSMDRGGVVRSGRALLDSGILYLNGKQIGIQEDPRCWIHAGNTSVGRPLLTDARDASGQRKTRVGLIVSDDECTQKRGLESSRLRRAKDSCKDRPKTYIEMSPSDDSRQRIHNGARVASRSAGEAHAIPGKYDRISQD